MEPYIKEVVGKDLVNLVISYIPGCYICGNTRNVIKLSKDHLAYKSLDGFIHTEDASCDILKRLIVPGVKNNDFICQFHLRERYSSYNNCAHCKNNGKYIDIDTNELVCQDHIINKRVIENHIMYCKELLCCNKTSYLNLTTLDNRCSIHKGDNYVLNILDYREDIKSNITCYNCSKQIEHYYTCTCGIIRCWLCMHTYSYLINKEIKCACCNNGQLSTKKYFSSYIQFSDAPTCKKDEDAVKCIPFINNKTNNLVCDCVSYYTKDIEFTNYICMPGKCNIRIQTRHADYCDYHNTYSSHLKRKIGTMLFLN